ncbi:root meristem growth factor 4 [Eutrema salsugineum]|uniref:root meristem growth factor 4 n=1 Tax=Eutrema salsugineum TaxID=72664 RepID=UPI000CED1E71|nr:root meristem growth factor 4 [Eutrema salsugineum]
MMRFTIIIILAFLLITQALEEDHILVYAHEGGDAGHKSLDYREDKDTSTLHRKELYEFSNIGAPRKLRARRTTRTKVARAEKKHLMATYNDNWSLKMSGDYKKTNLLADLDTTKFR